MTTSVNQGKTGELNPGKRTLWQKIWEHKLLYVMLIPMLAYLLVFCYYPMYGVILAFKDFNFSKGIMGSPLAKMHGFNNFMRLFRDPSFFEKHHRHQLRTAAFRVPGSGGIGASHQ